MTTTSAPRRPRVSLWLLRIGSTVFALGVLAQPVLAGGYLAGEFDLLQVHEAAAHGLDLTAMILFVIALAYWLAGRGSPRPAMVTFAMFFAVGMQTGMGHARVLQVHVPLGVLIVLLTVGLLLMVWHPSAARGRK